MNENYMTIEGKNILLIKIINDIDKIFNDNGENITTIDIFGVLETLKEKYNNEARIIADHIQAKNKINDIKDVVDKIEFLINKLDNKRN